MTILVTSRSGQGKTYFCRQFLKHVSAAYFNNDDVRRQTGNSSFDMNGRILAAQNMKKLADQSFAEIKLVDMICPTPELRKIVAPDVIVFIDGDKPSKYSDTDALYIRPTKDEAEHFFSGHTRKTDELVQRVVYLIQNHSRVPNV